MTRRVALLPFRLVGSAIGTVPKHVHWFRWADDDLLSNGSLYACRCGVVRPGL